MLQGIGYLVRKGISLASISLDINEYEAPPTAPNTSSTDIVTHIDIEQSASGLSNTHEKRCLDDTFREHSDWLFGKCRGRSAWVSLDEIDEAHLKSDWITEGEGKNFILSHVESVDNGWVARQIWGFQTIDGERRYTRNVSVTKGDKKVEIKLIYDFVS